MSDSNSLGSLVRKRRLESGYSLGQLASKVGKTAAEVRAWERGAELPEHGIISRLASTLEIDLAEIQKRLEEGKKALEAERKQAERVAVADEVAEKIKAEPDDPVEFPEESKADEIETSAEEPDDDDELPGFAVDDPFTPPVDWETGEQSAGPPNGEAAVEDDAEPDLLDAPTEAVPVPIITETATAARASRAAAVLEEPPPAPAFEPTPDSDPGLLRYLEPVRILFDPHNRYLYWIRAGLTAIVLLVFLVILFDQIGKLLDAFGELLDTFEPTAPDPDSLDV